MRIPTVWWSKWTALLVTAVFAFSLLLAVQPHISAHSEGRADVAVCVQVANPGRDSARAVAVVRETLTNKTANSPAWDAGLYRDKKIRVDAGCPSTPFLLTHGAKHPVLHGGDMPKVVQKLTPYQAYVVIVSEEDINRHFGSSGVRIAPQEMMCQGPNCREITAALYLSPDELSNSHILEDGLLRVLGLVQPYDTDNVPATSGRER